MTQSPTPEPLSGWSDEAKSTVPSETHYLSDGTESFRSADDESVPRGRNSFASIPPGRDSFASIPPGAYKSVGGKLYDNAEADQDVPSSGDSEILPSSGVEELPEQSTSRSADEKNESSTHSGVDLQRAASASSSSSSGVESRQDSGGFRVASATSKQGRGKKRSENNQQQNSSGPSSNQESVADDAPPVPYPRKSTGNEPNSSLEEARPDSHTNPELADVPSSVEPNGLNVEAQEVAASPEDVNVLGEVTVRLPSSSASQPPSANGTNSGADRKTNGWNPSSKISKNSSSPTPSSSPNSQSPQDTIGGTNTGKGHQSAAAKRRARKNKSKDAAQAARVEQQEPSQEVFEENASRRFAGVEEDTGDKATADDEKGLPDGDHGNQPPSEKTIPAGASASKSSVEDPRPESSSSLKPDKNESRDPPKEVEHAASPIPVNETPKSASVSPRATSSSPPSSGKRARKKMVVGVVTPRTEDEETKPDSSLRSKPKIEPGQQVEKLTPSSSSGAANGPSSRTGDHFWQKQQAWHDPKGEWDRTDVPTAGEVFVDEQRILGAGGFDFHSDDSGSDILVAMPARSHDTLGEDDFVGDIIQRVSSPSAWGDSVSPGEQSVEDALVGTSASKAGPPAAPASGGGVKGSKGASSPSSSPKRSPVSSDPVAETKPSDEGRNAPMSGTSSASGGKGPLSRTGSATGGPLTWAQRIWKQGAGKYDRETDDNPLWFKHRNHVFVFTFSGKPVYTRYGNDEEVSQFGVLQVIASKMAAFFHASNGKDVLRSITTAQRRFVFLEKGPLILVCITAHLNLAHAALEILLSRVYRQFVTIVTSEVERQLLQRPNLDIRNLLSGTQHVIGNLVRWSFNDMLLQVEGVESLPLDPAHRNVCIEALRSTRIPNLLLAFIIAGHRVVALVSNKQTKATYQVGDLVCVINYILSSNSLRGTESWTPICLPSISDRAFTYAYIGYIAGTDVCQVFFSYDNAGQQFMEISKGARRITQQLKDTHVLDAIQDAMGGCPVPVRYTGVKRVPYLSNSFQGQLAWLLDDIIHGCYYLEGSQQYFTSAVRVGYDPKYIFRNYSKCRELMTHCSLPSQICVATDNECFYVWLQSEFCMYLTVPRGISTSVIGQFYQWVQAQEMFLFLGNTPTW